MGKPKKKLSGYPAIIALCDELLMTQADKLKYIKAIAKKELDKG